MALKIYGGIFHCEKDGDFEWKTYDLEGGAAFFNYEDVLKNCISHYVDPTTKVCIATVKCPVCGRRFSATDPA